MTDDFEQERELIRKGLRDGEAQIGDLLSKHRDRLKRLVELRLDPRVRGRVDASDIIQETQVTAIQRWKEYLDDPEVPLFVWLRFLALQTLTVAHRRHLGTKARSASREVSLQKYPAETSAALAAQLVGQLTTASQTVEKAEDKLRLEQALGALDAKDREIITLRHYEQLSQKEAARVLGISEAAAGSRHVRAISRLRKTLQAAGISGIRSK